LRFQVSGLSLGYGVWGLRFGVWGLRFGVWGFTVCVWVSYRPAVNKNVPEGRGLSFEEDCGNKIRGQVPAAALHSQRDVQEDDANLWVKGGWG